MIPVLGRLVPIGETESPESRGLSDPAVSDFARDGMDSFPCARRDAGMILEREAHRRFVYTERAPLLLFE